MILRQNDPISQMNLSPTYETTVTLIVHHDRESEKECTNDLGQSPKFIMVLNTFISNTLINMHLTEILNGAIDYGSVEKNSFQVCKDCDKISQTVLPKSLLECSKSNLSNHCGVCQHL
jgi:hypothetical protein